MTTVTRLDTGTLPVVDLTDVRRQVAGSLDRTAAEVRQALTNVGFFSIVGHGVDWAQVDDIYEQAARYHSLPIEIRTGHTMSSSRMGYNPLGAAQKGERLPALNAAFFFARPGSNRNQLPTEDELPGFATAVSDFYRVMDEVGQIMLDLYAVAAGMPAVYFHQFFDPALATLRLTHYPPLPAAHDQWGIDPHSDAGFMTMLPANPVAGLCIKPDGGDWFEVEQEPESFVVNAGDMLRRWSNDRFLSTTHRALNRSDIDRYAIPYFFDPRPDTIIDVLPSMIDDEHPKRHDALVYRDYLSAFMADGYAAVRDNRD
ncbi:MAG: isopenicillin N synthase-like dioxygenase [Acidimicrobiales bacterium]